MRLLATFLVFTLLSPVSGTDAVAETRSMIDALKHYRKALSDERVEAAVSLTASFPELPIEVVRSETMDYAEAASSGKLRLWIFPASAKVIDGCGVLIIGDKDEPDADDPDPAYMIRQADEWKVLFELTQWDESCFDLTEEQEKAFKQLQIHAAEQKKQLREGRGRNVE